MKLARVVNTVTRWPFLIALALLLLNDFWLKARYPGLVTGKLSDFAGIAMVALPLLAAFPTRVRTIYLAIGAAFLWWKSPLSGSFIALANELLAFRIDRVVDYTDLVALLVLPACSFAIRDVPANARGVRRALALPVLAVAVFATAATSQLRPQLELRVRTIDPEIVLDQAALAGAIGDVMRKFRLTCYECAQPATKARYSGRDVSIDYFFPSPNTLDLKIYWIRGMFGDGEERLARRVRAALKDEFTLRFKGLEAIEPLRNPYRQPEQPRPCLSEATPAPHCTATEQDAATGAPP